jgi:hypothetical protein
MGYFLKNIPPELLNEGLDKLDEEHQQHQESRETGPHDR